jgi:hypothetical protein
MGAPNSGSAVRFPPRCARRRPLSPGVRTAAIGGGAVRLLLTLHSVRDALCAGPREKFNSPRSVASSLGWDDLRDLVFNASRGVSLSILAHLVTEILDRAAPRRDEVNKGTGALRERQF